MQDFLMRHARRVLLAPRSMYVLKALIESRGSWERFWMGERAGTGGSKKQE
jgi:hypothetical protein